MSQSEKESLFREITVLENEFKSKQQQKLNSLRKLESLKARTEEELGDNLLSEIQGRLTLELQTGINKIRLESNSVTVDYTIQLDWVDKLNVVKERIKEFSIKKVPNTVSYATHPKNVSLSKKAPKKKSKQKFSGYYARDAEPRNDWTRWPDQGLGEVIRKERNRGDVSWSGPYRRDETWGDDNYGDDTWGDS